jgi:Na+-transporting methylmalonyl-CoA/oxaloacetate decarboxylase gamma subunit
MAATMLKALLNTLMGMGTVFLVLIFISLVISLFKYIPVLSARFEARKQRKKEEERRSIIGRPAPKRPFFLKILSQSRKRKRSLSMMVSLFQ